MLCRFSRFSQALHSTNKERNRRHTQLVSTPLTTCVCLPPPNNTTQHNSMTSTSEKQEFGETGYPQNGGSSSAPPPPSYADPYPQTNYAYPPLAYPPPQPTSHAAPTSYAYPPQPTTLVVPPTSTATATPAPAPDYSAAIRRRKAWTYAILGAIFAATGAILLSFWNRSWYCYGTSCYVGPPPSSPSLSSN